MRAPTAAILLLALNLALTGCNSPARRFARAVSLERHHQPAKALSEYQEMLRSTPPNQPGTASQLHLRMGECLLRLDRVMEAFSAFQRSTEADPDNLAAHLRLAELYLAAGGLQTALEHARAVLVRQPANPEALALVGAAQQAGGDDRAAEQSYRQALQADPTRATVAIALADIAQRHGNPPLARQVLRRAADAAPHDPSPLLALGRLEEQAGDTAVAEAEYRAAVARENSPETNLRLAQFLERSARVREAEAVLRRSDELLPSRPVALADFEMISGRAFRALRRYLDTLRGETPSASAAGAISPAARATIAARLVEADLESPHGASTEPLPNVETSATQRARQHLQEFRRDVDPVTTAILQAEIALAENDLATATVRAAAAVTQSPPSAAAHYVLGVVKFHAGDVAGANLEWGIAVEKDPNFVPARLALARQALATGDMEAAEAHAVSVVREEPANLRALVLYARALAARRRFQPASIIANRALAVTEANPEPHMVLGEIALQRGNLAEALSEYERAVVVAPQSEPAIAGLVGVYRWGRVRRNMILHLETLGTQPPKSATILEIAGRLYAERGWYDDAIRALNSALAVDPRRSTAAVALARAYARQGRLSAAEDSALRAGDRNATLLAAARAQQRNQLDIAVREYESAVRQGDRSGIAANNLAWIYAQRGERLQRALALAEAARAQSPRNPAFLDTLGFVHLQRREYSEAVRALKQAVQVARFNGGPPDPVLPDIRRHLAEAYRLAGEPQAAETQP